MERENNIVIHHARNGGEFRIPKTNYKADGYCEEINTIYEFHGTFWHGHPDYYKSEDVNPISKKNYGELYRDTIERENLIKYLGYNLVVIWEHEWDVFAKSITPLTSLIKRFNISNNSAINPNINTYINPNINTYINPNINTYINPNINTDINTDNNPDINTDNNPDINTDINTDINY